MTDQQLAADVAASLPLPGLAIERVVEHVIALVERGPFVVARCAGCGWETFARRSRPLARREGKDHVLLHSPG
jgi:hypothetical protein